MSNFALVWQIWPFPSTTHWGVTRGNLYLNLYSQVLGVTIIYIISVSYFCVCWHTIVNLYCDMGVTIIIYLRIIFLCLLKYSFDKKKGFICRYKEGIIIIETDIAHKSNISWVIIQKMFCGDLRYVCSFEIVIKRIKSHILAFFHLQNWFFFANFKLF